MANVHVFTDRDTIEQEARGWLIRLDGDDEPSQSDIDALREWVDRSPAHHAELLRLSAFWNEANILTELSIPLHTKADKHHARFSPGTFSAWLSSFIPTKQAAVAMTICLLAIGMTITNWIIAPSNTEANGIYATAIGETRLQTLSDGSVLQINTDSQVQVDYSDETRKLRLIRGEAHFNVAKDPNWPFEVYAGQSRVKAVGTAFSVRLNQHNVKVTVSEGRVDLAARIEKVSDNLASNETNHQAEKTSVTNEPILKKIGSLTYGESATFSNQAISIPQDANDNIDNNLIEKVTILEDQELARELSWREGYLIFAGDPLNHVVAEVNRYTPITIDIADPALRELRIGGRFKIGELDAMLDVLETSFGIQVARLDDQHIQLLPIQQ